MDYNNIRTLLKKYWDGETDLAEEKTLKDFFSQAVALPADLEAEKELFSYYKQQESDPLLTDDLTGKLRQRWGAENQQPVKRMSVWRQALKYAAVLIPLLLLGYIILYNHEGNKKFTVQPDAFEDTKKAIAETEKALMILSQNMNDGLSKMETFRLFDEVKNSEKFKAEENPAAKK